MKKFDLKVDPQEYAVLSALEEDGEEVSSRSQLLGISVEEGAEKIFSITLSSTHSQNVSKYTLQVLRRLGFSTSLENLGFATGHLKETFHPQSEIDVYHALQDVKEDFAEVQCLKQDGGQEVWCTVQHMETLGDGKPSSAEFTLFPELYSPSLETRHSLETYYSGERARTVNCRVPIDTWREVIIGVNITSADKTRHRHLQLIVRRDGCRDDSFFYAGRCNSSLSSLSLRAALQLAMWCLWPQLWVLRPFRKVQTLQARHRTEEIWAKRWQLQDYTRTS